MFKTAFYLMVLCVLGTGADKIDTEQKPEASENSKITPQNISALYIGDLLRTKPRTDLQEAGSVQQPVRVTHHHPHRSFDDHRRPESHQYPRSQGSRSYVPVDAKTSVPVVGRFLSLRPVHFVHQEATPERGVQKDAQTYRKAAHYEGDDCPKGNEDHSYEARQYAPDDRRQYRRERQPVSSAEGGGYEDDGDRSVEYSSQTEPHRSTYNSNSHPTNTKSQSKTGSSYSKSKSSSTSKTMTPKRVKQAFTIVPKKFSEAVDDYEPTTPTTQGQDKVAAYKTREPRDHRYRPKEYGPSDNEAEPTPYSQYPPETSGHRKASATRGQTYGKDEERPSRLYSPYDSDRGSYEQSAYVPGRHYQPTESYHRGREHTTGSPVQEPTQYQNYQDPEPGHRYEAPRKPQRPYQDRHYGAEGGSYRKETSYQSTPPSPPPSYPNDQYSPVPEHHKPQSYRGYSHQGTTTPVYASGSSPHGGHQIVSPNVGQEDYLLDTTHHTRGGKSRHLKRQQYHEPRYARSSGQYTVDPNTGSAEESSVQPVNSPVTLSGVSHSVSYSNSGDGVQERPSEYRHQGMAPHAEKPVTYKPYNSEYPASYANDPMHRSGARQNRQYSPRSYERPDSYEHQDDRRRPYEDEGSESQEADPKDSSKSGHHYVSNIEGYRDEYHSDVPLHLDDAFFKKYGISKKAKIIVASAVDAGLLVADGSKVPEGGYKDEEEGGPYEDGYTPSEEEDDRRYASSAGDQEQQQQHQGPSNYNHQSNSNDEEDEEPVEHGHNDSPGSFEFGPPEPFGPKDLPGSFDDLVDTNAKFLRNLPVIMNPGDSAFKSEAGFDEDDFHNVAHKGFVVSQGPREIVQQHGDGVSRILFNVPKKEDDPFKMAEGDESLLSAASALLKEIVKSES